MDVAAFEHILLQMTFAILISLLQSYCNATFGFFRFSMLHLGFAQLLSLWVICYKASRLLYEVKEYFLWYVENAFLIQMVS